MNDEQSLIKVNPRLLSALSKGAFSIDVFAREILVLECLAAGTSFRKLDEVQDELKETVQLEMKREGDNEFDHFAIALWFENTKVGYIPKDKNEVIARLMDAGKQFYDTIHAKEMEGNWLKLEIKVILKD
ncbi:MAG: HIRAN domain-containing protein [Bacteroidota bacterium]|nr:HIRAN domain-containing protein [Bacteroidota bacterium]